MKAILISIQPQHVANILNGIKTLEIRKKFPKDYVGWVYIYCTKDKNNNLAFSGSKYIVLPRHALFDDCFLNGKVVARFWVDKVKEHKDFGMFPYRALRFNIATCLSEEDLEDYGFVEGKGYVPLYAIHITNLEIFDKPKEISEFSHYDNSQYQALPNGEQYKGVLEPLTRAPRNGYCYIEV